MARIAGENRLESSHIHTPRSYILTSLATALLASACIAAFCFIADPYKLYPAVPGLSPGTSVDLLFLMHLHTSHDVERVRPKILIAGSSRSATLPPNLLAKPGEISYNGSLPGAVMRDLRRMVEHAHALNPLSKVVFGLDLVMFQKGASAESIFPDEPYRYRKVDPGLSERLLFAFERFTDYWNSLYSMDAMIDSWTLLFGGGPSQFEFQDDGTWDLKGRGSDVPRFMYQSLVKDYYRQTINTKAAGIEFTELMDLLDFTEAQQIPTVLLILPMQGLLMNTIEYAGAWELYLDWQRELVMQVDARHADTQIYGLENLPKLVLEPIEVKHRMFEDGVHLTRRAGREIFTCLAGPCNPDFQPTLLDSHSIDTYLDQVDALRKQYAREKPADVKVMRKWITRDKRRVTEQSLWRNHPALNKF